MHYLRLTRGTPGRLQDGLEALRLALWEESNDGVRELDHVTVNSGAPGRQVFRTLQDQVSGHNEPIPEGEYLNLGQPEFAGGVGNWEGSWGEGLGPVWIDLYRPRSIGLHLDENRSYAPGSAGCVVAPTLSVLRRIVDWFGKYQIQKLQVDWGLGTVAKPNLDATETLILSRQPTAFRAERGGKRLPSGRLVIEWSPGLFGATLDGAYVPLQTLDLQGKVRTS